MKIWVCIPVLNRIEHTLKCLESLHQQTYKNYTIVVCDHGSTDGTSQKIRSSYPGVVVLEKDSDLWWTGAINCCIEYALQAGETGKDSILTLNNDLVVDSDYLSVLVDAFERHPHSLITSAGYDSDRQLVAPGLRLSWLTSKVKVLDPVDHCMPGENDLAIVTHAPGRGTLIPFQAFEDIGLFDVAHLPHYGADYDFSLRASSAGYPVIISYRAKVFNHVEATGMTVLQNEFSLSALKMYLTNIKSPANLSARWWLAINNCPRVLLPSFIALDFLFVVGSYFKVHLAKKISRSAT